MSSPEPVVIVFTVPVRATVGRLAEAVTVMSAVEALAVSEKALPTPVIAAALTVARLVPDIDRVRPCVPAAVIEVRSADCAADIVTVFAARPAEATVSVSTFAAERVEDTPAPTKFSVRASAAPSVATVVVKVPVLN